MYYDIDTTLEEYEKFTGKKFNGCTLEEVVVKASNEWKKLSPKNKKEFENFYKNSDTYILENVLYDLSGKKSALFPKIVYAFKQYELKKILDFGAGIGSYSIQLHKFKFVPFYYEISEKAKKFFEYRIKNRNMKIKIINDFSEEKYDCVMMIDVIEHLYDPFETLDLLANYAKSFLFTQSFGEHDEARGGMPYHTDYDMKNINKKLKELGYVKREIKVWFPPHFWIKKDYLKELEKLKIKNTLNGWI